MSDEIDAKPKPGPSEKDKQNNTLPVDKLENGVVEDRECTDKLCCLIFVAFIAGMVAVAGYGFLEGNPMLLLTTYDFNGNGCGMNETTKDYPYLYFPMIDLEAAKTLKPNAASISDVLAFSTCVKKCPGPTTSDPVECKPPTFMTQNTNEFKDCVYYVGGTDLPVPVPFRYETELFASKFCVPSSEALKTNAVKLFKEQFDKYLGGSGALEVVSDIIAAQYILAGALGSALLLGFIYMILMRFLGRCLVYASLLLIIAGTAYGGYMLFQVGSAMTDADQYKQAYLIGSYVTWGFTGCIVLCICCNYTNIEIGIGIMQCTALFINATPQVFLMPILALVFILTWLFVWVAQMAFLCSVGKIEPNPTLPFISTVTYTDEVRYALIYQLLGYLWVNNFLIGCTQFVISAACATWYFSKHSDNPSGSVCSGIWWIIRYHLGTLAFGSFIIALVQLIRIIFEYYAEKIEAANKENPLVKCLLCCTRCCLDCLERFVKFISKNAYIQCALTGKNFCASAWNAFILIMTNALRFGTVNSIGFIFVVLGVLFISSANAGGVYAVIHYVPQFKGIVSNWIGPVVVSAIEGVIIGTCFMSVYSFASDTILQAFMVDLELNRPGGLRPPVLDKFFEQLENDHKSSSGGRDVQPTDDQEGE